MKEQTMINTSANREIKEIGIGLAKTSFQLYAEDESERKVVNKKMTNKKLKEFMCRQLPCGVAMEACGIGTEWQMRRQYLKPPSFLICALSQLKRVDNKIGNPLDAQSIRLSRIKLHYSMKRLKG
jgi:hypothetical protein